MVAATIAPRFLKWSTMATPRAPALGGIGARPHLVEKDEGGRLHLAGHLHDGGEMGGEGGEARGDRLLVADVGVDATEDGQPGPRGGGHVHSRLRHEGEEAEGLEGDRLAPRVGAADDEDGLSVPQPERNRHGSPPSAHVLAQPFAEHRHQQGMSRLGQVQLEHLEDLRLHRVHVAGEEGLGLGEVEVAQDLDGEGEVVGPRTHPRRQLGEDANHFATLFVLQLDDVVVEGHRGQRLHEDALSRARAAVDHPRKQALVVGLHEQHEAVVAGGDDLVLQEPGGLVVAQVGLHDAS